MAPFCPPSTGRGPFRRSDRLVWSPRGSPRHRGGPSPRPAGGRPCPRSTGGDGLRSSAVRGAPFDVARARAETPGCAAVAHLDNAGSSLPPQPVLDAVIDHLRLEARLGGYRAAAVAEVSLERPYDAVAGLLGCGRHEVAVLDSATRAWGAVFWALTGGLRAGDRILVSRAEYASNALAVLQLTRRTGAVVEVVPD